MRSPHAARPAATASAFPPGARGTPTPRQVPPARVVSGFLFVCFCFFIMAIAPAALLPPHGFSLTKPPKRKGSQRGVERKRSPDAPLARVLGPRARARGAGPWRTRAPRPGAPSCERLRGCPRQTYSQVFSPFRIAVNEASFPPVCRSSSSWAVRGDAAEFLHTVWLRPAFTGRRGFRHMIPRRWRGETIWCLLSQCNTRYLISS